MATLLHKLFRQKPVLALLLINILLCILFFYPILGNLNTMMMSVGGDGIKNYFTYLYYIQYDQGMLFTGMNYPFGEHIVFTDNMPLLSWSIRALKPWVPFLASHSLAIMHTSFMLTYFLASVFIYRILALYGVKGWWAVVSAAFIAYFSPQFLRLFGHFGLSYTCFLPMLIYWLMRYERDGGLRHMLWIYLATVIFTFCHVYYLAFGLVLVAAWCGGVLIAVRRPFLKKIKYCIPPLLATGAALLTLNLFFRLTDHVKDRPVYPIGYLGSRISPEDILTSDLNFIGANVFRFITGRAVTSSEGYAYPGFVTILVCIFLLYRIARSIVLRAGRRVKVPAHPVRRHRVWLITALIALLFSMGAPFIWGMEFLVDYVSTFRQFRTIGRFSWIFYYLVMIYSAVWLYRYARFRTYHKQAARWWPAMPVLVLAIYFIELNGYAQQLHRTEKGAPDNYRNFFSQGADNWNTWLRQHGYALQDFQASIGLPYFHIGSEKLGLQDNDYQTTMFYGSQIAMQTGLGMMDVMMSRTSWSQTFSSVRFFDGPFAGKSIATMMTEKMKPFLLFVNTHYPLREGELNLLPYARFIGSRNGMDVFSFDVRKMQAGDRRITDSCKDVALQDSRREGLQGADDRFAVSVHFDDREHKESFLGKGALAAAGKGEKAFITIPLTHPTADTAFLLSTWMHCYPDRPEMPHIYYEQINAKGDIIVSGDCLANASTYVTEASWYLAEGKLIIRKEAQAIRLYARRGIKDFIALDELLIRPENSVYFYKSGNGIIMLNNRPVVIK